MHVLCCSHSWPLVLWACVWTFVLLDRSSSKDDAVVDWFCDSMLDVCGLACWGIRFNGVPCHVNRIGVRSDTWECLFSIQIADVSKVCTDHCSDSKVNPESPVVYTLQVVAIILIFSTFVSQLISREFVRDHLPELKSDYFREKIVSEKFDSSFVVIVVSLTFECFFEFIEEKAKNQDVWYWIPVKEAEIGCL